MAANADTRFFRIKAAQRDLIAMAGGIERAGELTSFGKSHVGRWNNAADPDLMPLAAVLALEAECGVPLVTSAMAELNGRRLADADVAGAATGDLMQGYGDLCRRVGDIISGFAAAIADGTVTPAEATTFDRGLSELERCVAELRKVTASVRGGGGMSVVEGRFSSRRGDAK